ncbi:hypothetical protein [Nocardioides sp. LHG3406-4]|uniref:hypothetical protein n=1 Tax=Nocardioides sp. LHG3406-4 TaxID=2804575 RepID=UPI003CF19CEF
MNIARGAADWPSSRVEDLIAAGHGLGGLPGEPCPAAISDDPIAGQVPETTPA